MAPHSSRGFSLVELAVVLVIFGLVLGFTIPLYGQFMNTQKLKGAGENIAAQLRLARQLAIETGKTQTMHFTTGLVINGVTTDYHIHNGAVVGPGWPLPQRITYTWPTGTVSSYTFSSDGRCSTSGMVILLDPKGAVDTISVQSSGMVTLQ